MEEILQSEKFKDNGFDNIRVSVSESKSNSDLAHIRANVFDKTGFEKWKAIFCELSCVSLNFWKSRPHGEGHRKIFACHYICHHGMNHKGVKKTSTG